MKKKELKKFAQIDNSTMAKLAGDENVLVGALAEICHTLDCTMDGIAGIMEE